MSSTHKKGINCMKKKSLWAWGLVLGGAASIALGGAWLYKRSKMISTWAQHPQGGLVKTAYGTFIVQEQVILELLESPAMKRIKKVNHYGARHFVEEKPQVYTRYEHCVGVWAILRRFGATLEEQIAGLLHDASHTVFSHVGDWVFKGTNQGDSYQDDVHAWYLKKSGVPAILANYNIALEQVLPKSGAHSMLEQDLPDLCADRIEYNLRGGILTGMLNQKDVDDLLNVLYYERGTWFFANATLAKKFSLVSLYHSENVWGAKHMYILDRFTAKALKRAFEIGLVTKDEVHFSVDDEVWQKLEQSNDPHVKECITAMRNVQKWYALVHPRQGEAVINAKFRGVNPWVQQQDGSMKRLTEIDPEYAREYNRVKEQVTKGWGVKFVNNVFKDGKKVPQWV